MTTRAVSAGPSRTPRSTGGPCKHPCTDAIAAKTATANLDTRYLFDEVGETTDVIAPNGTITHYTYDADGNTLTETTDYRPGYSGSDATVNATTTYTYDDAGRVVRVDDPAGVATVTVYGEDTHVCRTIENPTVDPLTLADPCTTALPAQSATENVDHRYEYDAAGNTIRTVEPSPVDGATPASTVTTLYVYDADSNLCRVVENAATGLDLTTLADPCQDDIEAASRPTSTPTSSTTTGHLVTQNVVGDPANGSRRPRPRSPMTSSAITTETDPTGLSTAWTYDPAGNQPQDRPRRPDQPWSYDAAGRLCRPDLRHTRCDTTSCQPCTSTTAGPALRPTPSMSRTRPATGLPR